MKSKHYTLSKAIVKTICYFDIFNTPLRIHKLQLLLYRYEESDIKKIQSKLNSLVSKKILETHDGYYFLPGRKRITKLREYRKNFCTNRWKRAQFAAKILSFIPYVRLVLVVNSLSFNNSNSNSDIDFYIVTKSSRLWVARALVVFVMDIFGLNKKKGKIANQICLGFFTDSRSMNQINLFFDKEDIHKAYWVSHASPIFSKNNTYKKFLRNNHWVKTILPNFTNKKARKYLSDYKIKLNQISNSVSNILEFVLNTKIGDLIENKISKIQIDRIKLLEKEKLPVTDLGLNIMRLGAYNKNRKFNQLVKKNYKRFYNE